MTEKKVLVPGPDHPITIEANPRLLTVVLDGREIASSSESLTLREASYAPVHYVPREHVDPDVLVPSEKATHCPYKGDASYFDVVVEGHVVENAAWTYPVAHAAVAAIAGHVAFHEDLVDRIEQTDAA